MITSVGQMIASNGDVNLEERQGGFIMATNTKKTVKSEVF